LGKGWLGRLPTRRGWQPSPHFQVGRSLGALGERVAGPLAHKTWVAAFTPPPSRKEPRGVGERFQKRTTQTARAGRGRGCAASPKADGSAAQPPPHSPPNRKKHGVHPVGQAPAHWSARQTGAGDIWPAKHILIIRRPQGVAEQLRCHPLYPKRKRMAPKPSDNQRICLRPYGFAGQGSPAKEPSGGWYFFSQPGLAPGAAPGRVHCSNGAAPRTLPTNRAATLPPQGPGPKNRARKPPSGGGAVFARAPQPAHLGPYMATSGGGALFARRPQNPRI